MGKMMESDGEARAGAASGRATATLGPLPNFLIIGAMKSATSSLRYYLDSHPQGFCAREVRFFDDSFARGIEWYRAHFAGAGDAIAVGEKSPSYMYRPDAIERIADAVPDAKLIAVLRDPVSRAYSHYWHWRSRGKEGLKFPKALDAEPQRLRESPPGMSLYAYVDRGRYLNQLQRVCERFPRERLHVVLFEELRDETPRVFSEACRFLGIDDTILPATLEDRTNVYKTHRPEWLWRTMQSRRLFRFMPGPMPKAVARLMERKASYEPISEAMRDRLRETFAEENRALARWLGRDLSVWQS